MFFCFQIQTSMYNFFTETYVFNTNVFFTEILKLSIQKISDGTESHHLPTVNQIFSGRNETAFYVCFCLRTLLLVVAK